MVSGYTTSNPARTRVTRLIWSWKGGGGGGGFGRRSRLRIAGQEKATLEEYKCGVQVHFTGYGISEISRYSSLSIDVPFPPFSLTPLAYRPTIQRISTLLRAWSRDQDYLRGEGGRIESILFICLYSRGTVCARNLGYHKRSGNLKICIYRLLLVFISLSRVPWDICKLNCIGIFKNYSIVSMASFPQSS